MDNLILSEVPDAPFYPRVEFDAETGVCEIIGESYMEETHKFYLPLINWLKKYISEKNAPITLNLKLTYFNTSSSRQILDMLDVLKNYQDKGGEVTINWYYDPEDPDMQDEVEDFTIETGMEINLLSL